MRLTSQLADSEVFNIKSYNISLTQLDCQDGAGPRSFVICPSALVTILVRLVSVHPETISCHSERAKNLCGPTNYEILRRLAPQNDIQNHGFRMDTN